MTRWWLVSCGQVEVEVEVEVFTCQIQRVQISVNEMTDTSRPRPGPLELKRQQDRKEICFSSQRGSEGVHVVQPAAFEAPRQGIVSSRQHCRPRLRLCLPAELEAKHSVLQRRSGRNPGSTTGHSDHPDPDLLGRIPVGRATCLQEEECVIEERDLDIKSSTAASSFQANYLDGYDSNRTQGHAMQKIASQSSCTPTPKHFRLTMFLVASQTCPIL